MSKLAISVDGYIANDLTIRNVTGHRVVDISVPHTPRKQDGSNWVDAGPTEWFRATFWDEHADAVLLSVQKKSLVTITGGLKASTYAKNDGTTAVTLEITFPVLSVVVPRPKRGEAAQGVGPVEEPWSSSPPSESASGDVWNQPGGSYSDESPF